MKSAEDILELNCPSMNNLYLDSNGREFKDRVLNAMNEYLDEFKESNYYAKEVELINKAREEEKQSLDNLMQFVNEHIIKDQPEKFVGRKMDEVIIEYCKGIK